MEERTGVFAAGDNQLTLLGPEITVGQTAPNFTVSGAGLSRITLDNYAGKVKIIASVPSLDTGVCSDETKQFSDFAKSMSDDIVVLTISMDLPFAQARWCGANDVDNVETASDFKSREFGDSYGVHVKEKRLARPRRLRAGQGQRRAPCGVCAADSPTPQLRRRPSRRQRSRRLASMIFPSFPRFYSSFLRKQESRDFRTARNTRKAGP